MEKKLFIKYIQNRCSDQELEQVISWFEKDAGSVSGRVFLSDLWNQMRDDDQEIDQDFSHLLNRIHHDLNMKNTEELLKRSRNNLPAFKRKKEKLASLMRFAAILFIPLFLGTVFFSGRNLFTSPSVSNVVSPAMMTRVYSPAGSISQVNLPDGTRVWLNYNTTLTYPGSFDDEAREITLTGEAYFEVVHDPSAPFIVKTGDMHVVAVGTSFNVMAYPEDQSVETTLVEGKVILKKKNKEGKFLPVMQMNPGEIATYDDKAGKLNCGFDNVNKYILWKEGKLLFENDPLDVVAKRLSRFYNVEIEIKDPKLAEFTYTATFMDETINQVMELLELATPIDYSIGSRTRHKDGSYTKRKVSIYYKGE